MIARARKKQSDIRDAIDAHLDKLPERALLRDVVASRDIEERLARFDQADTTALKEQKSYRRFGRLALWAMMTGTIIGALLLLPTERWIDGRPRKITEALQALALILTFIAVIWIALRQSVGQWMQSRAAAERTRADVFRAIVRAGANAKEVLAPALACFKDAHLDWQLGYFNNRGRRHRQSAGNATPFKVVGYLLAAVAVCLGVVGLANLADDLGFPPWPSVRTVVDWLLPYQPARWQLGLGAIASSILAFASARSFMDQDDRNASCYALAAAELQRIRTTDLPRAEAAAAAGNAADVMAFCEKVQAILDAEHLAWVYTRPPDVVPVVPEPKL